MVSAVKSRPNHYEVLGIKPGAASDAIAQAFARATSVFRPHAFGGITELCVAYETLRDPARRRAYDASIGIKREPPRAPAPRQISAHFMVQPAFVATSLPEPKVEPKPPEPKVEPEPLMQSRPAQVEAPLPLPPADDDFHAGFSSVDWKRTGTIVGGLVAAAIFVGAITGWWSGRSAAEPEQAAPAAVAPKEKAPPSFSELWPEPEPHAGAPLTGRRMATAKPPVEPVPARRQLAASEAETQLIQPPQDLVDPPSNDPLAPEAQTAPAVAAGMPLPHSTVARTLDRIGYRCGSVASATAVEGASGVYKVTCTSGQSFQAKPVNGRYRFRRLAGN